MTLKNLILNNPIFESCMKFNVATMGNIDIIGNIDAKLHCTKYHQVKGTYQK